MAFKLVGAGILDVVDQVEDRHRTDRRGFNALPGGTEPRAEAGGMRASVMARMVRGMSHAGCHHEPVRQNETQQ